jgi:predicted transcriptional regulator
MTATTTRAIVTETTHDFILVDVYGDIIERIQFSTVKAAWDVAAQLQDNELGSNIATVESVRDNFVNGARTFKRSGFVRSLANHVMTDEQRHWLTADTKFYAAGMAPDFSTSEDR